MQEGLLDAVYREFARRKLRDAVELARKALDDSDIEICVELAIKEFNERDQSELIYCDLI